MSVSAHSALRRWDGKLKEARVWNSLARDPELSIPDANCYIYLCSEHLSREQPSFTIPFEHLVYLKCQPLIEQAAAPEILIPNVSLSSASQRATRQPPCKQSCSLYLEAPQQYDDDDIIQYHVTTRNFFAWMMEKPIVGPDPASALLALKVRMDLWRSRTADNFATLYEYARAQGYGDLGDISLFLTNHLKGTTVQPTGYKLMPAIEIKPKSQVPSSRLKESIRRHVRTMNSRTSRPRRSLDNPARPRSRSSSDITYLPVGIGDHSIAMSGAIPPAKDITERSMSSFLPQQMDTATGVSSTRSSMSLKRPLSLTATSPSVQQEKRRYSMSDIQRGNSSDILPQLQKQSSWIKASSKEHYRVVACQPQVSKPALVHSTPTPAPSQGPVSPTRHKRPSSLSRPPSPILEEDVASSGLHSNAIELPKAGAIYRDPASWPVVPPLPQRATNRPTLISSSSDDNARKQLATAPESVVSQRPMTAPMTSHAVLPSHLVFHCQSCGKHRSPAHVEGVFRQQARSTKREMTQQLQLDGKGKGLQQETLSYKQEQSSQWSPEQKQQGDSASLTRFPSLHNLIASYSTDALPVEEPLDAHQFKKRRWSMPTQTKPDVIASQETHSPPTTGNYEPAAISRDSSFELQTPILALATDTLLPPKHSFHNGTARRLPRFSTSASAVARSRTYARTKSMFPSITNLASKRNHRIPLDELQLGNSQVHFMDEMLQEIIRPAKPSNMRPKHRVLRVLSPEPEPWAKIINMGPDSPLSAKETKEQPVMRPQHNRAVSIKGLRNSLWSWTATKSQQKGTPKVQHQGCVLTMDKFGNFTSLPSPLDSPDDFDDLWDERQVERSKTPLCELA